MTESDVVNYGLPLLGLYAAVLAFVICLLSVAKRADEEIEEHYREIRERGKVSRAHANGIGRPEPSSVTPLRRPYCLSVVESDFADENETLTAYRLRIDRGRGDAA